MPARKPAFAASSTPSLSASPVRMAIIGETGGKFAEDPDALLDFPKHQTATVTGHGSAVKLRPDTAMF